MKFASRKFIICAAIVLGGIASVISGVCTSNNTLIIIGSVCGTISGCLYALVECICDTTSMDDSVVEDAIDEDGDSVG